MKRVKDHYDKTASSYDEVFNSLYYRIYDEITWKYLEPYLPNEEKAVALDAGGGTGRWTLKMAQKGCKVVLMDLSENMLATARQRIKQAKLQERVRVKNGDITKTEFGNDTFDLVFCEHALFLFKDPNPLISELVRILKEKGRLIVSAQNRYVQSLAMLSVKPSEDNVDRVFKNLMSRSHECLTEEGFVKIYTWPPAEFRLMLERNRLQVEKIVGKGMSMPIRVEKETYLSQEYSEKLFQQILRLELSLCENQDALALAGHMQAIARKI